MHRDVELTLSLVTPLFLHGADPRGAPELRAPSVRGALRFWLRAALAQPDLADLHREEDAVFGATGHASPVRVRVWPGQGSPVEANHGATLQTMVGRAPLGVNYLGFAFRPDRERPAAQGFASGTFRIGLGPRCQEDVPCALPRAMAALWLLQALGGLGGRSRRGFGSLHPAGGRDPDGLTRGVPLPSFAVRSVSPAAHAQYLRQGMQRVRALLSPTDGEDDGALPSYSMLRPGWVRVGVLGERWSRWQDCLDAVGLTLADYRRNLHPREQRVGFGLPLDPFHYGDVQRRASPLLVKVVRLADSPQTPGETTPGHSYTAVVTVLMAELVPSKAVPQPPPTTAQQVAGFLDRLETDFGLYEVALA